MAVIKVCCYKNCEEHRFLQYFEDSEDYPDVLGHNILPMDTLWSYVGSYFLDGFIHFIKPVKAYVLGRYLSWDGIVEYGTYGGKGYTKTQVFEKIINSTSLGSRFYDFCDDVSLLGFGSDQKTYWYFRYDLDSSDCSIGRFQTDDNHEKVLEVFDHYINVFLKIESDLSPHGAREIPLNLLTRSMS